ncbi:unnamed protein product [Rotaria magnacalcarata]|uniref:Uncharacterized protein n=1 Tax=Rotaria magnacalcarata TaxID=392030 RepID=A0A814MVH0_9BILA|nr:unnamed protein product [Rotaria magnacalcarata]CAF3938015.1 unnamed protein product [Rotaria magnacalcarata]CAF4013031.1 unnamed protein product [Rotaria magnacalcarata]
MTRAPLCYYYSSQKSECLQKIILSDLHQLGPGQLPFEFDGASHDDASFIPSYYWTTSFVFDTALIITTNHCTKGSSNVNLSCGNWQTPLGVADIHIDLFNTFVSILGKRLIINATIDCNHYGPNYGQNRVGNFFEYEEYARIHDKPILQLTLSNDPKQLLETQWTTQNSMCELWSSLIIMISSKILNNNKGHRKTSLLRR